MNLSNVGLLDQEVSKNITGGANMKNERLQMAEHAANGGFVPPKELPIEDKPTEDYSSGLDKSMGDDNYSVPSYSKPIYKPTINDDDDKILGMPKAVFWIAVAALVLGAGFFVYKKIISKKKLVSGADNLDVTNIQNA